MVTDIAAICAYSNEPTTSQNEHTEEAIDPIYSFTVDYLVLSPAILRETTKKKNKIGLASLCKCLKKIFSLPLSPCPMSMQCHLEMSNEHIDTHTHWG